jgi:hypothetical protein
LRKLFFFALQKMNKSSRKNFNASAQELYNATTSNCTLPPHPTVHCHHIQLYTASTSNCTLPPHPESARSCFPLYHIDFFKRHAPYMRIQRKHQSINPVQNDARLKQPDGPEARRYYLQPPSPSLRRRRPRCEASAAAIGR